MPRGCHRAGARPCPAPPPRRGTQSPLCGRRRQGSPRHDRQPLGTGCYSRSARLSPSAPGGGGRDGARRRRAAEGAGTAAAPNVAACGTAGPSRQRGAAAASAASSGASGRVPLAQPRHSPPPPPPSSSMSGPQAGRAATAASEGGPKIAPLARRLAPAAPPPPRSAAASLSAQPCPSPGGRSPAARPSHVTRQGRRGGRPGRPAPPPPPPQGRRPPPGRLLPSGTGEPPPPASLGRCPLPGGVRAALRALAGPPRGRSGAGGVRLAGQPPGRGRRAVAEELRGAVASVGVHGGWGHPRGLR